MYDPYFILDLKQTATKDEAKASYRRLASKFHPDKFSSTADKIAAEEQFKKIKSAWEAIDNGWIAPPVVKNEVWRAERSAPQSQPRVDSTFSQVVAYAELEKLRKVTGDFVARPSISQAFYGFTLVIPTPSKTYRIQIPPGIPSGIRLQVRIGHELATVCLILTQSQYRFQSLMAAKREHILYNDEPAVVYRTRDLETTCQINLTSIRGHKIEMIDVAGKPFSFMVSRNQDFSKPLIIPGRGYFDWITSHSIAGKNRGDVTVKFAVTENLEVNHGNQW
jgi:hypothetical protein